MTYFWDDRDVGGWTLLQVLERRAALAIECQTCWRIAQRELQPLIFRFSAETTLAEIERRAICERCQSRRAKVLIQFAGIRGNRAWRPCPPSAGR